MEIVQTNTFQKDLKRCKKRGYKEKKFLEVIEKIKLKKLEPKHRPHKWKSDLEGKKDVWELHIKPDWLLLYRKDKDTLYLLRTGTHSDFGI